MNLPGVAIRRPVLVWVFFIALTVLGIFAVLRLKVTLLPDVNIPVVTVRTAYPGAGPDQIETLITKPVEDALSTTNNLKELYSVSVEGFSMVIAEFTMDVAPEVAAADVREKIAGIRGSLPEDAKEPEILKLDINAQPILYLSFIGPDLRTVYDLADNRIKPALQTVAGVGNIDIVGGRKREIRVEVFPEKLVYYGSDLLDVANRLARENVNLPSGHYSAGDREVSGRLDSEFVAPTEIEKIQIPVFQPGTGVIRKVPLAGLARVRDTFAEVRTKTSVDQKEAVALIVQKQPAGNTIKVVDEVVKEIGRLQASLPPGFELSMVVDNSVFIRDAVADVRGNLFLGVLITAGVLFLFLSSLGSTLVVAISIPISLVGTFFFMYLSGFTLNVLTLSSLALCTGVIIDSSIVVLENIYRNRRELQKEIFQAVEDGTTEVTGAVLASMLTNIVVFLPIAFLTSIVGQFFREFGLVQIYATLVALMISFTLLPMLASRLLKNPSQTAWAGRSEARFVGLREKYRQVLPKILTRPRLVFGVVCLLLVISFSLVPLIGTEFAGQPDQGISSIDIRMPSGTNLEKTETVVRAVEEELKKLPELEQTFTTVGSISGGVIGVGSEGPEYARIIIRWKERRKRSAQEILRGVKPFLASQPGAVITVTESSSVAGRGGAPLETYVTGPTWNTVVPASARILAAARETPGVADADSTYHPGKPEMHFEVKREELAEFDLSPQDVALNARAALEGLVTTKFREGENEYDIRVTIPEAMKRERQVLENLPLINGMGDLHLLKQCADITEATGPTMKERYNRIPSVTVSANVTQPLGTVWQAFNSRVKAMALPREIELKSGGDVTLMKEAFRDLGTALALAVILVYLVMAAQFESWIDPFIIMGTMPLAIIGVLVGLFLFGKTISIFSLLGVVILVGIGVNNGILIIDFSKTLIARGKDPLSAVVEASSLRLRPCLMTSAATIAGTLPLAFGMGKAASFKAPMGVAIISGVFSSTVLTLFVIPLLYYLYASRKHRKR